MLILFHLDEFRGFILLFGLWIQRRVVQMVAEFYLGQAGISLGHTDHDEKASNSSWKIPQGLAKWQSRRGRTARPYVSGLSSCLCLENLQHLSPPHLFPTRQHISHCVLLHTFTNSKRLMLIFLSGLRCKMHFCMKDKIIICTCANVISVFL